MIAFLKGQVLSIEQTSAVILVLGVGYKVNLAKPSLDILSINQETEVHIHTSVKEDSIDLYGFFSLEEKKVFQMLISTSGIGPKIALAILSSLKLKDLLNAIINKDINTLCSIPGIGKKSAERLSLELKEKALKINPVFLEQAPALNKSVETLYLAIKGLGFSKDQCDLAIKNFSKDDFELPFEIIVKKALNVILRRE